MNDSQRRHSRSSDQRHSADRRASGPAHHLHGGRAAEAAPLPGESTG